MISLETAAIGRYGCAAGASRLAACATLGAPAQEYEPCARGKSRQCVPATACNAGGVPRIARGRAEAAARRPLRAHSCPTMAGASCGRLRAISSMWLMIYHAWNTTRCDGLLKRSAGSTRGTARAICCYAKQGSATALGKPGRDTCVLWGITRRMAVHKLDRRPGDQVRTLAVL